MDAEAWAAIAVPAFAWLTLGLSLFAMRSRGCLCCRKAPHTI